MMDCVALLTCPVCGLSLEAVEGGVQCAARHMFNRAREGYIDLLATGHGLTRAHGDTRDMIEARGRVLERGLFGALADALGAAVVRHARPRVAAERAVVLLEAGCGVGYYVRSAAHDVRSALPAADVAAFGFDISRVALRRAATADRSGCWFVNDVRHAISMRAGSVDVLLNVFAPRNPAEFARVLRADGVVLLAIPVSGHLAELRRYVPLLRIDADKHERVGRLMKPHFASATLHSVRDSVRVEPADVLDLVLMSPSRWHTEPADLSRHLPDEPIDATIAVDVLELCRFDGADPEPG